MKTLSIYRILILAILGLFTLPTIIQAGIVYSPDGKSGSFTFNGAADIRAMDWNYCWEITIPTNIPVTLSLSTKSFDIVRVTEDYIDLFNTDCPGMAQRTIISTTGKLYVYSSRGTSFIPQGDIFILNFTSDNSFVINESLNAKGNVYIDGYLGIGTTSLSERLVVNGNISAGATSKIKLMDFPGQGSWIDIPAVSGKASGIGSGGAGVNAWIGYAGSANQWFTGSSTGDICYRNTIGKLLFGNIPSSGPAMAISGNKVSIGSTSFTDNFTIGGSNTWIGQSIRSNTSSGGAYIDFYKASGTKFAGLTMDEPVNSLILRTYGENGKVKLQTNYIDRFIIDGNGKTGVGTTPSFKFHIRGDNANSDQMTLGSTTTGNFALTSADGGAYGLFGGISSTGRAWLQAGRYDTNTAYDLTLQAAGGNVGIGTTPNGLYKLDVKGAIRATEVLVQDISQFVPDYVFESDYLLPTLPEVHDFIKANKHLPDIPSAAQVKENGMSLVDMQLKLLQKIEELTLYVIEQQKRIDELEKNLK